MGCPSTLAVARVAMTATGLTGEVVDAARGPLGELGFQKRSGEIFTAGVANGVLGWLGLNRAYRRSEDALEVNPVVGVRNQAVERLVAELRAEKFHPYQPPTVSTPLGYLTAPGKYTPWLFTRGGVAVATEMSNLVAAVAEFGLPFMRESSDLGGLRHLIEEKMGFAHQLIYRHPVVCLLAGDNDMALRVLETSLAELGQRTDPAAAEFRSFADRFRVRAGQGP